MIKVFVICRKKVGTRNPVKDFKQYSDICFVLQNYHFANIWKSEFQDWKIKGK